MFKTWCGLMKSLTAADDALRAMSQQDTVLTRETYDATLRQLHTDLQQLDRRNGLARIAALIVKAEG